MRPIRFVKYYEKASTVLGGDQIAEELARRGFDSRSIPVAELDGVQNSILVFVKTSRLDQLLGARLRGNLTVLDVQDTPVFKRRLKNGGLFDGAIFRNRRQVEDLARRSWCSEVIPLQWDPRYRPNQVPAGEFRAVYLGDRRSLAFFDELPGVECVENDLFARAPAFNCQLSVRQPGREFLYKPGVKVSTAAACRAVLVTTADVTAVELLGEDYPFFCGSDRDSVVAALERARQSLGGPLWDAALERLEAVRERTRLERVVDDHLAFFARLEAEAGRGTGRRLG